MCDHGTLTAVELHDWRRPGGPKRTVKVDSCFAALVAGLDRAGLRMVGSCCGHRRRAGAVLLADGGELHINTYATVMRSEPRAELREIDGRWWQELPDDSRYVHLGFCPTPTGARQTFIHHMCHGIMMGYPLFDVLAYAWRHRYPAQSAEKGKK